MKESIKPSYNQLAEAMKMFTTYGATTKSTIDYSDMYLASEKRDDNGELISVTYWSNYGGPEECNIR